MAGARSHNFNLCPFAKAVHRKQQIRYAVTAARNADELLAELEHELALLADADPGDLDTNALKGPGSNYLR